VPLDSLWWLCKLGHWITALAGKVILGAQDSSCQLRMMFSGSSVAKRSVRVCNGLLVNICAACGLNV
jgi:hypothetical protein